MILRLEGISYTLLKALLVRNLKISGLHFRNNTQLVLHDEVIATTSFNVCNVKYSLSCTKM